MARHEYGFYANVNPMVDHPRWSQAREKRLPSFIANHRTEMFNGYAEQVQSLCRAWTCARILKPITAFRVVLFAAALTPAAALAGFYRLTYAGDFNALTANPGDYITDQTGTWALGCLAASLSSHRSAADWMERDHQGAAHARAVRVLLRDVAHAHVGRVRPLLRGVFMIEDVVKRPFITVGMTTFLILLVLALTSNRFSIKLGRRWGKLHRLAYVAAAGGTLHFWQLVKADTTEPWRWAAGFALLFGLRVWWAYRPRLSMAAARQRANVKGQRTQASRIV